MKATFNGTVIAESDRTVVVEGNHYFPADGVHMEFLTANGESSVCPWKGRAEYYDVAVGDQVARGAAWSYPAPSKAASEIAGHYAFWRGVTVSD
ncbi:MAG: DUF427 domain-containing protein [Anaerosomatales bacterium]|nr:DUF427 domain-containing protein [Coriobacteriia bacterium]